MELRTTSTTDRRARAFTFAEYLVAMAIGSLIFVVVGALSFHFARSFVALTNYTELENKSSSALDTMTREIRQALNLKSFSQTNLVFTDYDSNTLAYVYNPSARTLVRTKSGVTTTLLTGCESLSFLTFQRNPTNNYNVVATTNAALCKLVQLNWKCSRSILSSNINSESVQSAKVVIRKE